MRPQTTEGQFSRGGHSSGRLACLTCSGMTKLALGGGAALMNATMAVSSATATLVVGDRLDVAWAALPATAGILGTGLGSVFVAARIARGGYRRGLRAGYLVAVR